tara:strand:+ start:214 stop:507 length:294 start_codon:yes stop_codon:yes gene_type:complete
MSLFDTVTVASGSHSEEPPEEGAFTEREIYLFSIQKDMLVQAASYINKHETKTMDPLEEQRMVQYLVDSGIAWSPSLPEKYEKLAKELIKEGKVYIN